VIPIRQPAANGRVVSAVVFINGRKVLSLHGSNLRQVVLRRLPKKRFTVRVVATTNTGLVQDSRRIYLGCRKTKRIEHKHRRPHH
jgi:hypothetical protein